MACGPIRRRPATSRTCTVSTSAYRSPASTRALTWSSGFSAPWRPAERANAVDVRSLSAAARDSLRPAPSGDVPGLRGDLADDLPFAELRGGDAQDAGAVGIAAVDGEAEDTVAERDVFDRVGHLAREQVCDVGVDGFAALDALRMAGRVLGVDELERGVVGVQRRQGGPVAIGEGAAERGDVECGGGGDGGHGRTVSPV